MDFEFTEDQQELRDSARAFLEKECPISLVRRLVEEDDPPEALCKAMVQLDWPALTIPENLGGLGLGWVELGVVLEELGRVIAPGPFLATQTQFTPAVREAGSVDQQQRWLGPVARGELRGTIAVAEEDGDWEPDAVRATARRDGDDWVLEGAKHYVVDGTTAEEFVVATRLADTVGSAGITLFVVPRSAVRAERLSVLDASQELATVHFDAVRVQSDRLLGEPGESRTALQRATEEAVAAIAMTTLGTCQTIFDMTLEYAKFREQFGVPIGSFQAVKHKLADMYVGLERARAVCYFAALTIAEEDERRTLAVSMAKAAVGECQRLVVQDGLQLHGGIGYTWEHDLHLFLKRAKSGDAQFGTAADHRARVAELIGLSAE
jgi:alkylation response protein AidB-like acyl-CoA dehydrogenase